MEELKIALVQVQLHWENPKENLAMFDEILSTLKNKANLVVLPEMFSTGFSMKAPELAEEMDGTSVQWMRGKAKELNAVITGSIIITEKDKFYNRLIWMRPDGSHAQYDKKHLFTLAKEHHTFTAGTEKLIVELGGWKICPLVCYDLRFPVWSRNTENYDLLIYIANFPAKRRNAWRQLLRARAIENQAYALGVNITGKDGNGLEYAGDSAVIGPLGEEIEELQIEQGVILATIYKKTVIDIREKLPFLNDRDLFSIDS